MNNKVIISEAFDALRGGIKAEKKPLVEQKCSSDSIDVDNIWSEVDEMCQGDWEYATTLLQHVLQRVESAEYDGNPDFKVVKGKTLDDYMSLWGDDYNNGDLWDFDPQDLTDGSIEPSDEMEYWEIDGRYYEAPRNAFDEALREEKYSAKGLKLGLSGKELKSAEKLLSSGALKDDEFKAYIKMLKDDNKEKGKKKIGETYQKIWSDEDIFAFSNYYNAEAKAKELGLKLAEYGDMYGHEGMSYVYWNETGDRNDDEKVICYYFFDKDGKAKNTVSKDELAQIADAYGMPASDIDDANEVIDDESCNEDVLTERAWKHVLKSGVALRKAIDDEDYQAIVDNMVNVYKEAISILDEDDAADFETALEDLKISLYNNGESGELDYENHDNISEDIDYYLSELYDLCDAYNLFVAISESLTEAEMSPEDRAESDAIRNLYKNMGGKVNVKKLPQDQQDALNKNNLRAWGYYGDKKIVTPKGYDVVKPREFERSYSWKAEDDSKSTKINYADRARKLDSRDYAKTVKNPYWNSKFDDDEREYQARVMGDKVNKVKWANNAIKSAEANLNDANKNYKGHVDYINKEADKKVADAKDHRDWVIKDSEKDKEEAEARIKARLDKHRNAIKAKAESLQEKMSPEDEEDTKTLWGIYDKFGDGRHKLTQKEKDTLAKLGLEEPTNFDTHNHVIYKKDSYWDKEKHDDMLNRFGYNDKFYQRALVPSNYVKRKGGWGNFEKNTKVNLADKARKLDNSREYASKLWDFANSHKVNNKSFDEKERLRNAEIMGKDVEDTKNDLGDIKHSDERKANAENELNIKLSDIENERNNSLANAEQEHKNWVAKNQKRLANAKGIKAKALGKEESLTEEKRNVRVIPTGLEGDKAHDMLNSVIGQMSDGMWENSPGMGRYWEHCTIDGNNNIVVYDEYSKYRTSSNGFSGMSDDKVRAFFGNKIKRIAQQELHDNNKNPYDNFNANNTEDELVYLSYDENITVADAYNAFKQLTK